MVVWQNSGAHRELMTRRMREGTTSMPGAQQQEPDPQFLCILDLSGPYSCDE